MRLTTTGDAPIAAASSARPGLTTLSRTFPKEQILRQPAPGGLLNEYERAA